MDDVNLSKTHRHFILFAFSNDSKICTKKWSLVCEPRNRFLINAHRKKQYISSYLICVNLVRNFNNSFVNASFKLRYVDSFKPEKITSKKKLIRDNRDIASSMRFYFF